MRLDHSILFMAEDSGMKNKIPKTIKLTIMLMPASGGGCGIPVLVFRMSQRFFLLQQSFGTAEGMEKNSRMPAFQAQEQFYLISNG